ncbi:MAG: BppU family phage baseplate upper protein [Treponema sp.]|nr:BppU family phage baseplate upper protein [Candidatus Treponema caballi]
MNVSTYRFSLDLDKQDSQEYVTVRQGDTAKCLSVLIKESGTPYIITDGTAAVLSAKKPDGTYITADCTITEENRVEVVLPATFTANVGILECCIQLTEDSAALSSPPFAINVEDKPTA